MRSLSSEFPNDNPRCHLGVSWVGLTVTGAPSPVFEPFVDDAEATTVDAYVEWVRAAEAVDALTERALSPRESGIMLVACKEIPSSFSFEDALVDDVEPIIVDELPPLPASVATEGTPDDAFATLIGALEAVAVLAGSPRVASMVTELLRNARLELPLGAEVYSALVGAAIIDPDGQATAPFANATRAWRAILTGRTEDFDACGGLMLDEWCADLLARLMGAPGRAHGLRKDLRARGVAAFGLAA